MILIKEAKRLEDHLSAVRQKGQTIGFVPTMGALHQGHLSLISQCKTASGYTVSSIFVNPTQFNDPGDFEKYPVTIEQDILLLERSGCDVLFLPDIKEIYPNQPNKPVSFDLGYLDAILEGYYRPGHFQGVCQVVSRLLGIIQPDMLFMGQKDYQQCMVVKKLIEITHSKTDLVVCNTSRELSGLAMSSRNMRLSSIEKEKALAIYHTLQWLKTNIKAGPVKKLIEAGKEQISKAGFEKIDYIAIARADNLQLIAEWDGQTPIIALVAAFLNGVRLIDNLVLKK